MSAFTPATLLSAIQADLLTWAAANKAHLSIARDPWNVLELLGESPAGLRLILHWRGDRELGGQEQAPIATQLLEVIVSCNLGLTLKPDKALIADTAMRPSLLKLVSDVRGRVLGMQFPDELTGQFVRYAGCESVTTPDGVPLAAWRLSFELDAALPDFTYRSIAEPTS